MKLQLICETCGKEFLRNKGEVNRNAKKGRRTYCSLKCVGKDNNAHLDKWKCNLQMGGNLQIGGNHGDKYSPFRYVMKCITNKKSGRSSRKPCEITLEDIKQQWEKQNGICPYTGWELKLQKNTKERLDFTPDRASLDRIDSSKSYTKDNIQFVSMMAQFAKNKWHERELLKFCNAVVENSQH
jgi:hypothetical protein